ncbi:FxSxx-COOH cyclophane-containing RiPP peptide [Streptomyces heilongjiangensis]|uniref:FxSxx-COOH cyclophane-containing RiPP peptide n=1 Tax=Streptomyces heilongjiangensis TaxID=945052 RepID=A0ABW1BGL9_9ACTN|nr:FxSxx-COOH cyclophane-containing RiPP peptide [Streptomyces heilongjiangensis]MDC2951715.1 FxSxx-COOH protein [Streptomyces heilongjiangensis]
MKASPVPAQRVPLVQLAARAGGPASPALARVVSNVPEGKGPGRVSVAAFQSSV